MSIYRGPGGAGDAVNDASSEASIVTALVDQATTQATNAQTSANSAAASASSASTYATNAGVAKTAAEAAQAAAEDAQAAAETAEANAETAEANAETAEANAETAQAAAETAETNANASAALAQDWATKTTGTVAGGEYSAKYHAQAAATSASNASSSASSASTSATNAASSASSAATAATNAAASYDSFDDRYLGAKSTPPTVDNDGNTLLVGALYFNTVSKFMKVWDGSSWLDAYASVSGAITGVDGIAPIVVTDGTTPEVSITQATTSTNGYLSSTDWNTFNNKLGTAAIGVSVQAYDADTAKYDDTTANFTGTLQKSGSNVLTASNIGSTVQGYDANTTKNNATNTFTANQIVSVTDNTNAALRITQTGTGNALVVEDSGNPDSTPFVIDATGGISTGGGTAPAVGGIGLKSTVAFGPQVNLYNSVNDANSSYTRHYKDRAGAIVQSGDALGIYAFYGYDGATYRAASHITGGVDNTPGSGDMPGNLIFSTTADGASSPTERMRISSTGVLSTSYAARGVISALTDGATITPDFNTANNFSVTLGGNRTLANPSNLTAGQSGSIFITQDGTGSRTLAFGSYWDFIGGTAPTLTTTAAGVDRIDYIVRSSTSIHAVFTANYS